ncbi:MAG TPA: hypothetical protein VH561_22285 [Micromonosporaceae bacterium]
MPTSVLLAVLVAAGLLALAPALSRRHDPPVPAPESDASTARVLSRHRRRRTVPGARPINPPRVAPISAARAQSAPSARTVSSPVMSARAPAARPSSPHTQSTPRPAASRSSARNRVALRHESRPRRRRPAPSALRRRRRVFVALVALNLVELGGVVLLGPGFWIGFSVAFVVLLADLGYLRHSAVVAARRRRAQHRRQAWIEAQQAAIRREHERRAAEREALARRIGASRLDARRLAIPRTERYPRRTS